MTVPSWRLSLRVSLRQFLEIKSFLMACCMRKSTKVIFEGALPYLSYCARHFQVKQSPELQDFIATIFFLNVYKSSFIWLIIEEQKLQLPLNKREQRMSCSGSSSKPCMESVITRFNMLEHGLLLSLTGDRGVAKIYINIYICTCIYN